MGVLVAPDPDMPSIVEVARHCRVGSCEAGAPEAITSLASEVVDMLEIVVAPRGCRGTLGKQPILAFSLAGTSERKFVQALSARKGPFMAEFGILTGVSGSWSDLQPPFRLAHATKQLGELRVPAVCSESELGLELAKWAVEADRELEWASLEQSRLEANMVEISAAEAIDYKELRATVQANAATERALRAARRMQQGIRAAT